MIGAFDGDRPISTSGDDLLGRNQFAMRVAAVLARQASDEPIVVGLYGPWGSGKTSVLNLVDKELRGTADVVIVNFNPWYFSGEIQLLERFFEEIAAALGSKPVPARKQAAGALRKYLGVLKPAAKLLSVVSDVMLPGSGMVARGIAEVAAPAVEGAIGIGEPAAEMLDREVSIVDVRDVVSKSLREANVRIVVMVDDIDRLEPTDVRTVLKLVRLVGDLPRVSYLLSFDPEVVARSLSRDWGDEANSAKGREYLEKIVQVAIQLPRLRKEDLRRIALSGIEEALKLHSIELADGEARRLVEGWVTGIEAGIGTIRQVKRALSSIVFSIGLLKGEVDIVDLILLEALRTIYPKVFEAIRKEPERVLRTGGFKVSRRLVGEQEQPTTGLLDSQLEQIAPAERRAVVSLLGSLFPRFSAEHNYSSEFDVGWRQEQRVASGEHLEKALGYGIPAGIVSDAQYDEMLKLAAAGDGSGFSEILGVLVKRNGWSDILWRFRQDHSSWPQHVPDMIAVAVAKGAAEFSRNDGFVGMSTCRNGALFVTGVLWAERERANVASVAASMIDDAATLYFSGLVLQLMESTEEEKVSLGNWGDAISRARAAFAERARNEFDLPRVVESIDLDEVMVVMSCWRRSAGQGVMESVVRGWVANNPMFARHFVRLFIPRLAKRDFETSVIWGTLLMDRYRALCSLVSPVLIARALGYEAGAGVEEPIDTEKAALLPHLEQAQLLFMEAHRRGMAVDAP